jgi:hypothetical protein
MSPLTRTRRRGATAGPATGVAEELLREATEQVLASAEITEALHRSHISAEDARTAVNRGTPQIIAEASAEYQAYVTATAQRMETAVKTDALIIGAVVFPFAYLALGPWSLTAMGWFILAFVTPLAFGLLGSVRIAGKRRAGETARTAGQRWRDAMRDDALLPYLRDWITKEAAADLFGTRLDPQVAPGLIERSEPKHLVTTASTQEIARITATTSSGSLGLSGPRGSGKTTLISSFCAGGYPRPQSAPELRVMVSAPVDYEGRAFILHLFVQLCHAVLDTVPARDERPLLTRIPRPRRALQILLGLYLTLVGAIACWDTWNPAPAGKPAWHATLMAGATGLGLAAIAAGLALAGMLGRDATPPAIPDQPRSGSMAERTRRQLRRLKFVQTISTMSNATVKVSAPLGADLGGSFTRQLAEQQLSLPELVEEYKRYATEVAYWWRAQNNGEGRLFIGIDEVDRIVDPDRVQRFLNEVKAVFNVPYCFYLVSVSEEALAAFERRSLTARTTFDTAFDEVVRVDYLTYQAATELLSKRVAGLPRPFIGLCHCLAGGLPRDLVRYARTLVEAARETPEPDLRTLARTLVAKELHALKHGHLTRLGGLGLQALHPLAVLAYDPSWPDISPAGLLRAAREDLPPDRLTAEDDPVTPLALELATACRFHATLLEIVEHPKFPDRLRDPESPEAGIVDRLAEIRGLMTTNRPLALQLITNLRTVEGLP